MVLKKKKKKKHLEEQQESTRETRTHTHGEETGKRGKSYTVSREDDKLYGLTTNRFYPFGRSSTQEQHHHHHHHRRCLAYHHQSTPQTSLTFPSSHTHTNTPPTHIHPALSTSTPFSISTASTTTITSCLDYSVDSRGRCLSDRCRLGSARIGNTTSILSSL